METISSEDTVEEAIYVYIMDFDCGAVQSCTQLPKFLKNFYYNDGAQVPPQNQ
jgi:hypothetical protein